MQMRSNGNLIANNETAEKIIRGYFIVTNSETELSEGFYEEINPKALEGLDFSDVRALVDHDTAKVLGRTKANTLTLKVDEKGLYGEIIVNESDQEAMNLYSRVQRGDVDQCSFGFNVLNETYEQKADGTTKVTVNEIELIEVSVVTFPAYEDTSVQARAKQFKELANEQKNKKIRGKLNGIKTINSKQTN